MSQYDRHCMYTSLHQAKAVHQLYNFSSLSYADFCNIQTSISRSLVGFWTFDGVVLISQTDQKSLRPLVLKVLYMVPCASIDKK